MSSEPRIPSQLWTRAAAVRDRLLMLDYDGTLVPFRIKREEAEPPHLLLDLLRGISSSGRTRIAVISGRPIEELRRFLGHLPVRLVGEHGWETQSLDGQVIRYPLSTNSATALDQAAAAVSMEPWVGRIEIKRTSLMLHTRGLPHDEARHMESCCARLWAPTLAGDDLRLHCVNGGIELRAPGRNKAIAVRELISDSPPDALAVYVGDDDTDEDAFHEIRSRGFGLLVAPEDRPSFAVGRIRSIEEMAAFLESWLQRLESGDNTSRPPPLHLRQA